MYSAAGVLRSGARVARPDKGSLAEPHTPLGVVFCERVEMRICVCVCGGGSGKTSLGAGELCLFEGTCLCPDLQEGESGISFRGLSHVPMSLHHTVTQPAPAPRFGRGT